MKSLTLIAAVFTLATLPVVAQQPSIGQSQSTLSERSYFDYKGSFAGSSKTLNNNTTSAYDRNGHYAGQAIHNSNGTTSLYDARGHFTGSSVNTSPQRSGR